MRKNITLFLIAITIFIMLDILWLGVIAKDFYQQQLGHLLKSKFDFISAVIFYIIFITTLLIFVILPGLKDNSLQKTFILSILFGLVTYGTYSLTNYATMNSFPLLVVPIDMMWGILLTVMTSTLTFYIYRRFNFDTRK